MNMEVSPSTIGDALARFKDESPAKDATQESLGELFLEFFRYYGYVPQPLTTVGGGFLRQ